MFWYAVRMATFDLVDTTRKYLAVIVIGGSTLRNQGEGTVRRVQDYLLDSVNLANLATKHASAARYGAWLDGHTDRLLAAIGGKHRPWGTARKAMNMFVRACICNHHLRERFDLGRLEPVAEMPLDSVSAKALKVFAGPGGLPMWPGLRNLRKPESDRFQRYAAERTVLIGATARIYLDFALWVENRAK